MEQDEEIIDSLVIESSNSGVEVEVGDDEGSSSSSNGVHKPNFPQISAKDLNVSPPLQTVERKAKKVF